MGKFEITYDLWPYVTYKVSIRDVSNYTFLEFLWQDKHFDTVFKEMEHFSTFDSSKTLKVNGRHFGNATVRRISEKCCLLFY